MFKRWTVTTYNYRITKYGLIYSINSFKPKNIIINNIKKNNDNKYKISCIKNIFNTTNFNKKIYIICWEVDIIKGINIDSEIVYNCIKDIGINVELLYIPYSYINKFDKNINKLLLDRDIYIFSEVCNENIYNFLFEKRKDIILIPNIRFIFNK